MIAPFLVWADDITIKLNQQGEIVYCSTPVFIAPNLNIDGSLVVTSMKVSISVGYANGEDELLPPTNPGPITAVWNAQLGSMTLTGSSNINDYVLAIRQIMYRDRRTTPMTGKRTITISLADAEYFPTNQHYYIFIDKPGITWTAAKAEAESPAMKYHGLQGYLATITSTGENTFIRQKTKGVGWIGATDQAVEGDWRWVTGPEGLDDGGQGRYFWRGTGYDAKSNPASYGPIGGAYHNWNKWNIRYTATTPKNTWEPNQTGEEDYAHITLFPKDFMNSYKWNDYPNAGGTGDYLPAGYLIEYGGMPGDPIINLSADLTIQVSSIVFSPFRVYSRCQGTAGQINIRETSATYSWLPTTGLSDPHISNPIAKPDVSTVYSVVASNGTCKDSAKFTVNINPLPVSLLNDKEIICSGTKVTLDPGLHSAYYWDNKATSRTIVVSTAGKYIVRLTSNNGCTLRDTVTVTVQTAPKMDLSGMNRFICGSKATTLKISKDKGEWLITNMFNNQKFTTPAIQVAANGNYPFNLKLSDPNGCSVDTTVTISFYDFPIVNLGRDTAICISKSIILNAGFGFDSYLWSTKETTAAITVKNPGTYSVFVKDKNNCSAKDSIQISNADRLLIDLSGVDTLVCGIKTTKVNIKGEEGKFILKSKDPAIQPNGMSVTVPKFGAYPFAIVASDQSSCYADTSVVINFHETPPLELGNDTTICNPETIILKAGAGFSSYLWSTQETTPEITIKSSGEYSILAKDKGNCTLKDTIKIDFANKIKIDLSGLDTLVCGLKSTKVNIKTDLSKYRLVAKDSTINIDGRSVTVLKYGSYQFSLVSTNKSSCSSDTSFTISFHEAPTVNLGNDTTICNPNTITLDAGTGYASCLWSTRDTSRTILVKKTGIYHVFIKNKYNCSARDTIKIGLVDKMKVDLSSLDTLVCGFKSTNLNIKVELDKYNLKGKDPTTVIDGLTASVPKFGTYNFALIATDHSGCYSDTSFMVSFHEAPSVNLGNDTTMCGTNSIVLNAGAGFTSYLWSTQETTPTILAKKSGTYSVLIKNNYNCTASDTLKIGLVDSKIDLSGLETLICGQKATQLNIKAPEGKFLLKCNDSSVGIDGMYVSVSNYGTYPFAIVAVEKSSCFTDSSFTVSFREAPTINLGNDTTICNPKAILLNAGAGFSSYLWSTKETTPTISANKAGIYSVVVKNNYNCSATDVIRISQVDSMKVDLSRLDTLICGSKITAVNINFEPGKYLLQSNDASVRIDGMTATVPNFGSYPFALVAADKTSCYSESAFNISFQDVPAVNLGNDTILCNPKTITLNAGTGFTSYLWSTFETTPTIKVTTTGIYRVLVRNKFNCTASDTVNIGFVDNMKADLSGLDTLICGTKVSTLNVQPEKGKYILSSRNLSVKIDGMTATVPQNGIYPFTLVATDKSSCYVDVSFNLNFKQPPIVSFTLDSTTCQGYSFDAKYSGNSDISRTKFTWILANDTLENGIGKDRISVNYGAIPVKKGLVLLVNERGCMNQSAIQQINMIPGLNFTVSDTLLCEPSAFVFSTISTKKVVDFLWDWGDGTVDQLGYSPATHKYTNVGNYSVQLTATTDKGCTRTIKKESLVYYAPTPTVAFSMKENLCLDLGSHTIYDQGSGGVNDRYIWDLSSLLPADLVKNPGSTKGPLIFDLKSVPSARIGLQVISKDGCASEKKTMLLQRKPLFSIQAKDSSGCAPYTATLISVTADPIDQVDYSWNFGDGKLAAGSKVSHAYSIPNKIYDVTLAAKSKITGCRDTLFKPKLIRVYPNPTAAFKVDLRTLSIGNLEAVFANQSVDAVHYKWTFDDGSISELKDPTHKYEGVGRRRVFLESTNQYGCSDTISEEIIVPLYKIYTPNAFSPRALNVADREFFPYANGVIEQGYHLKILSRWDEIIFESKDKLKGWNGYLSDGSLAPVGSYIWLLYYEDFLGKYHYQSGTVTLVY